LLSLSPITMMSLILWASVKSYGMTRLAKSLWAGVGQRAGD
jgi:hypothetical protein